MRHMGNNEEPTRRVSPRAAEIGAVVISIMFNIFIDISVCGQNTSAPTYVYIRYGLYTVKG